MKEPMKYVSVSERKLHEELRKRYKLKEYSSSSSPTYQKPDVDMKARYDLHKKMAGS